MEAGRVVTRNEMAGALHGFGLAIGDDLQHAFDRLGGEHLAIAADHVERRAANPGERVPAGFFGVAGGVDWTPYVGIVFP